MAMRPKKVSARKKQGMTQRTTIDLPQDIWIELKVQAAHQRRSMKEIILDAVQAHLRRGRRMGGQA
jgi:hypothetical protein